MWETSGRCGRLSWECERLKGRIWECEWVWRWGWGWGRGREDEGCPFDAILVDTKSGRSLDSTLIIVSQCTFLYCVIRYHSLAVLEETHSATAVKGEEMCAYADRRRGFNSNLQPANRVFVENPGQPISHIHLRRSLLIPRAAPSLNCHKRVTVIQRYRRIINMLSSSITTCSHHQNSYNSHEPPTSTPYTPLISPSAIK